MVSNFIGRVLEGDVGKRVYLVRNEAGDSDLLQVENDEQREARRLGEREPVGGR
jgi:hypothetical protein